MNNVKKLLFGLAALAILCFFTAPVVWAGPIAPESLDEQWFKLKVKSVGYTSIYDASTDTNNIQGKKIFKNKKVYVHFGWDGDDYEYSVYTRINASGEWAMVYGDFSPLMMNTAKKYMILPMYFMVNKDKMELPIITSLAFMKFKIKTNNAGDFKSAVVKSVAGLAEGYWSDDPEEEFLGNCTITGKSVKEGDLPFDPEGIEPE